MYEPTDAFVTPRFTGVRTFARLPVVTTFEDVDCALFGMPWDSGTSFRSGPRFGPEAIRSASALLRPYNPAQEVQVFGALSCVDHGDSPTVPGYIEDTLGRIADYVRPIAEAGVIGLGMGGDHSVTLAELRAYAAVHGPLGFLQLDSHTDLWDSYFGRPYNHGTVFRRALEERLIDPARSFQAGMRGSLYDPGDVRIAADLGIEMVPWRTLAGISAAEFGDRVRARLGDGPAFFSFDVDFVDPAFAPGTGTPEVGGPSSFEALEYVRALGGIDFRGFDCVEVSPPYDGPGQVTALVGANVLYEMLSLVARRRRG
jgi:agmatinase